jgi:hypothetical protein
MAGPYTRPTTYPDFCLAGTRTSPSGSEINTGYQPDQIPPCEEHNWLVGTTGDWVRWLDQQQQANAASLEFDAVVGTNGNYPDINTLCAAITGGAVINKVLVTTLQTLAATQIIPSTITDLELVFKPSAFYSKGGSVTPGLQIAGQRITIRGGRWMNFSGGSDVAIQLTSASKNCRISDINFYLCTTAVQDLGNNNTIEGICEEV